MTADPTGRRARKKADTRRAIADAAISQSLDHGYENVTVEMIADVADVSTRTFFNYFRTKEDAVTMIDPEFPERMTTCIMDGPTGEHPVDALERAVRLAVDMANDDRALMQKRRRLLAKNRELASRLSGRIHQIDRTFAAAYAARFGWKNSNEPAPLLLASLTGELIRTSIGRSQKDADIYLALAIEQIQDGFARPHTAGEPS
jgi:AcrR family transcriptional regulator